jgi:diacylglycerol O-acyltransferase
MTATASIRAQPGRPVVERASPTDRAFLAMEARGRMPEQFGVILLLDQAGGLDLAQARQLIAERVPAVPRLRPRLIRPPFGCGGPIWVDDPHFDIRRHVRAVACRARQTSRRCWRPPWRRSRPRCRAPRRCGPRR